MAEKLCELRKKGGGGGKYTETSLWTNSAPTSSFSAQAVTLSQSMADFKYLKIKVAPSTTSTSGRYFEDIVLVSELQRTQSSVQEGVRDRLVLGFARTTYDYERPYYYASNTSIYFMATAQAGTNTTNNSRNIPLEILGLNELAHGTVQTATGTCERGASPVTVNLGFRPSFVSLYKTNASSSGTSAGDSLFVADTGFSTSYVLSAYKESSGSTFTKVAMNNYITITDTGFTFASSSSATFRGTYRYVAIGSTTE